MKESTYEKYKLVIDEWFVNGFNGTAAYKKNYPNASINSCDASFRKIYGNTRIEAYVIEKQKELAKELKISIEGQLMELEIIKNQSKKIHKYNDAINAVKEQNKLLGFYRENNEQKTVNLIPILNIDPLEDFIPKSNE